MKYKPICPFCNSNYIKQFKDENRSCFCFDCEEYFELDKEPVINKKQSTKEMFENMTKFFFNSLCNCKK